MIESLKLRFGRAPGVEPNAIPTTPVTVFVGPNYSGKSRVLQEIHRYVTEGQPSQTDVILEKVTFIKFPEDVAQEIVRSMELKPHVNETVMPGHVVIGKRGYRNNVPRQRLINALMKPEGDESALAQWCLRPSTMILDGKSRIGLTQEQPAGDLQQPPQTSFQSLLRDNIRRTELRRIIHDAFGVYLVIDPTNLGRLRLRLSPTTPATEFDERGIHEEAVQFHSRALPIEQGSDGIKAFAGMMTEIIAGDPAILLIDEPEAFLHPALKINKQFRQYFVRFGNWEYRQQAS